MALGLLSLDPTGRAGKCPRKRVRSNPCLSWAHDYPKPAAYNTLCGSLDDVLHHHPAKAAVHVNIELIRRLAERRDDRGKLCHPDIGTVGVVDGMLIEADVQQRGTGGDPRLKHLLHGPRRKKVEPVAYAENGNIRRFCTGYKLMLIADMSTTLPLVWSLIPANGDEREEALHLLKVLFEIWPECPMDALVGDSLYDHSIEFAYELHFDWGVQPVFPTSGQYSTTLPHHATNGIPVCACGELMLYKDTDGHIYTAKKRAKLGIPRGVRAPRIDGRLRFKCRNGRCPSVSIRLADDPRLYTYYHRGGDHRLAHCRTAFLIRRNAVESIFSSLQQLGIGGKGVNRPRWADDVEMDWLVSAALTCQTARRLAHETGLYEQALDEFTELGLSETASEECPAPGPDATQLQVIKEARERELEPATPPRSWDPSPPDR